MFLRLLLTTIIIGLLFTGCGGLTTETGTRTTTYDDNGAVVSVTESVAIGDPSTEMYQTIRQVATSSARHIEARAQAIKELAAPAQDDGPDLVAWKTAFAALAVAQIEDHTAEAIKAVPKATTGYDVGLAGIDAAKTTLAVGIPVYGAVRAVEYLASRWGDGGGVHIEGDGNTTNVATSSDGDAAVNLIPPAIEEEEEAPEPAAMPRRPSTI